jgi:hypothetical protein
MTAASEEISCAKEVKLETINWSTESILNIPEICFVIVICLGVLFYTEVHISTLVMHYFKLNFALGGIIFITSRYILIASKIPLSCNKIMIEFVQFRINLNRKIAAYHA